MIKNEFLQAGLDRHEETIAVLLRQLNGVDQYLCVNNMEIVGLDKPEVNVTDESMVIEAIKNMGMSTPLTPNDINICHNLLSNRKDKKRVVICKFISRKTKSMVIQTKRNNKDYKYQGIDFFYQ